MYRNTGATNFRLIDIFRLQWNGGTRFKIDENFNVMFSENDVGNGDLMFHVESDTGTRDGEVVKF